MQTVISCPHCAAELEVSESGKVSCWQCGGHVLVDLPVEAPLEVLAPEPPFIPPPVIPQPERRYAAVMKYTKSSIGSVVAVIVGFLLLFAFPIGTVIGIILMCAAAGAEKKFRCSLCGNPVADNHVRMCPCCHAVLLSR